MIWLGLFLGAGFAAGIVLAIAGWNGWEPPRLSEVVRGTGRLERDRLIKTLAVVAVVGLVTRWPVAAVAAGLLTWMWPRLFGGAAESRAHLARLAAIATWSESLRDTIAAAIGLEQAIIASADAAPDAITPELNRLVGRLRSHVPLPRALAMFAEEFEDASVDLVVAALIMNSQLRGSGLVGTLTALASTARSELEMRTRVEEGRKNLRRSARIITGVTLVFAGGITLLSRDYLTPYDNPIGQLVLLLVVGGFFGGFAWIRSVSRVELPARMLARPEDLEIGPIS